MRRDPHISPEREAQLTALIRGMVEDSPLYEPLVKAAMSAHAIPRETAEREIRIFLLREALRRELGVPPPPPLPPSLRSSAT